MSKYFIYPYALALAFLPVAAGAQGFGSLDNALDTLTDWLNDLIPLMIGIAVVVFLWGVLKYVMAGDDAEKRKSGGALMAYGVLAIFVMVSVWGLVNILVDTFNLDNTVPTDIPEVPTSN
jgi:hypothetical protein